MIEIEIPRNSEDGSILVPTLFFTISGNPASELIIIELTKIYKDKFNYQFLIFDSEILINLEGHQAAIALWDDFDYSDRPKKGFPKYFTGVAGNVKGKPTWAIGTFWGVRVFTGEDNLRIIQKGDHIGTVHSRIINSAKQISSWFMSKPPKPLRDLKEKKIKKQERYHNKISTITYGFVERLEDGLMPWGASMGWSEEEEKYRKQKSILVGMMNADVNNLISKIDLLPVPPVSMSDKVFAKSVQKKFQQTLVNFLVEYCNSDGNFLKLNTLVDLITDLFRNPEIIFYLSRWDNSSVVIDRLFKCVKDDKIIVTTLTCPDYSGYYEDNLFGGKKWIFDFKSLNCEEGVVARKAYKYVKAFSFVCKKHITNVTISHHMPTFEFSFDSGFQGKMSKEETTIALRKSLAEIKKYYDASGMKVGVGLSDDVINDVTFEAMRSEVKTNLCKRYANEKEFSKYVLYVSVKRKKMYDRWFPSDSLMTDNERREYIFDKII